MACRTPMSATSALRPRRLVGCVLARQLWHMSLLPLGLQSLAPTAGDCNLAEWWLHHREQLQAQVRPSFDSMVLLVTWTLWKERNARVFRRRASAAPAMAKEMLMEAELWCDAGFRISLAAFAMIDLVAKSFDHVIVAVCIQ